MVNQPVHFSIETPSWTVINLFCAAQSYTDFFILSKHPAFVQKELELTTLPSA